MFTDNTLTPKEAVRVCALGTLADSDMTYGDLARSIRHFMAMVIGPSLDVMAPSIELLRYEGLIAVEDTQDIEAANVSITDAGILALKALLTAPLRMGATELNKLLITLKFRFLHHLDTVDQTAQIEILQAFVENERDRLMELKAVVEQKPGNLNGWLDHDIDLLESRLSWLKSFTPRR